MDANVSNSRALYMFDFGKFLGWIQGGLLDSASTWQTYKEQAHGWQATAMQFSAPLVVAWGLLAVVLGSIFGTGGGFSSFMMPLVSSIVWLGLGSFIASFLAPKFGGSGSFDQAFAALSFAMIPAAVGGVLGSLPWIGLLLALGGSIWSIMLLWQALPVFLDITLDRRTGHFFATLGLSLVGMFATYGLMGALGLGGLMMGDTAQTGNYERTERSANRRLESAGNNTRDQSSDDDDLWSYGEPDNGEPTSNSNSDAGLFGFGREMDYLEQAGEDRYTPPADGKLDDEQVQRTIKFFAAANRLREASTESFDKLKDENKEPSLGDIFKGVKGLVGAGTAEMQAVKSGGGNWAEHEWVKKQLFEARIHQDLNNTTAHNYELYQEHEAALKEWL